MAPGMCRRCNRRRAQHLCSVCLAEEGRKHPLYLRPDLLQGAGYGELLGHGASLLMINEPGRRVELMNGPLEVPRGQADVQGILRLLGAEEQTNPFPLLKGDADELHDAMKRLTQDLDNPSSVEALGQTFGFLARLQGIPEELKVDWASGLRALRAPPPPPSPTAAAAPPRAPVSAETAALSEKLSEWEARLKSLEERLATERAEMENSRKIADEKETYLGGLEKTLHRKEESLKSWEARVREAEAAAEKERARADDLMRNLEELQNRMAQKEKELITFEANLGRQQEDLKSSESSREALERELLGKAREQAQRELQDERERVANEGQMVNIWRQALAAKEQELEERMKALDDERKRMSKPRGRQPSASSHAPQAQSQAEEQVKSK